MSNNKTRKVLLEAAAAEIDMLLAREEASETMMLPDMVDTVLADHAAIGLATARTWWSCANKDVGQVSQCNPRPASDYTQWAEKGG
jgi:hypothetical protein